ncbi:hypothetical protein A7982_12147 [Minicystis rosea]|nr:hypothetical protein A7982_12147 [Minicystis rosea]
MGWDAIAFAERNGCTLSVHAEGEEAARHEVSVEDAKRVCAAKPKRVYVDFDEPDRGTGFA